MKMPKSLTMWRATLAFVALFMSGAGAQAPVQPQSIVLRAARLVDVVRGVIVDNPMVVIAGETIVSVGVASPVPPGARAIDLGAVTLLPGLIDCHTHLLTDFADFADEYIDALVMLTQMSTAKRSLLGAVKARETLEAGITIVRDVGNAGVNGDVASRDAINAGWAEGPRMVVSTRALSPTGGQFGTLSPAAQQLIAEEYVVVAGADDARRAVRQAFYDGADAIKVIVDNDFAILSLAEMSAIVEEAHRIGRKVAAHAISLEAMRIAVEAGVDSLDHGYTAPDELLREMAKKQIYLVPTDYLTDVRRMIIELKPRPPAELAHLLADATKAGDVRRDRLRRARQLGVRIAAGSDAYYRLPGHTRGGFAVKIFTDYTQSGMTPLEIIRAATLNAADLLGWADRVGSIEAGKFADIIAVAGDPLRDITELERVHFVMKGGRTVRNAGDTKRVE